MKVRGDVGIILLAAVFVALVVSAFVGWTCNIAKLAKCDFEAPYKAEAIRIVGIFPPVGAIVGYMNIKDGEAK